MERELKGELREFVDDKTTSEFWFEPSGLRWHNVTRVGNVHDLLHADGIEGKCEFHFSAIDASFEFAQTSQSSNEVDTLIRTQVLDAEDFVKDILGGYRNIKHPYWVLVVIGVVHGLQAVPHPIKIKRELV